MDRILLAALLSGLLFGHGCERPSSRNGEPRWVADLIERFQAEPIGNPPQSIWRYDYKGQRVYYIPAQCCDKFSRLFDEKGGLLCAPDGGLTGEGDGRCADFFRVRTKETLVWRDPRTN